MHTTTLVRNFFSAYRSALTVLPLIFFILPGIVQAQPSPDDDASNSSFRANILPSITVPLIQQNVTIDGNLDEEVWQNAAVASNFSETSPEEKALPPIAIRALLAYDENNLYVAYIIEDDPDQIRANMSDRDQIWQDDYAGMLLDTNGDGQVTYFISANPLGIQGDTRSGNGNEDVSFDLIYESAGQLTETGYQVEMAIPFRSLRFPKADIQEWRATFWITHPREDRNTYSWAGIDRDDPCMSCQFGTIRGMKNIRSGRNLEILPAFTGNQSSSRDFSNPGSGFNNEGLSTEPSLNLKYGITSDLTLDATINPDFSQIESDAAQIDVNSTFALSFPERRAFFQEGADLFDTQINAVYTRSINDPVAASKLSGRFGGWTIGYIGARDETSPILIPFEESSRLASGGKSVSNIFRARRSFENNSFIAALATDRRLDDGGAGSVVGVDGAVRFLTKYQFSWQALASRTSELNDAELSSESGLNGITFGDDGYTADLDGEDFWGHSLATRLNRNARNYGFNLNYQQLSPTFRAANGFIFNNDLRRFNAGNNYTFWTPESGFMNRVNVFVGVNRIWNFDNVRKDESVFVGFNAQLKKQTSVSAFTFTSNELFAGEQFNRIQRVNVNVNSNFSESVQAGFRINFGDAIFRDPGAPVIGDQFDAGGNLTVKPTNRMTVFTNFNYSRLRNRETGENYFSGYILRSRANYQFTRKLLSRVIVQYNDFSESLEIDPLVTYRISPFTVFHFGSSHRYQDFPGSSDSQSLVFQQTSRQIFFKLQYLFRM